MAKGKYSGKAFIFGVKERPLKTPLRLIRIGDTTQPVGKFCQYYQYSYLDGSERIGTLEEAWFDRVADEAAKNDGIFVIHLHNEYPICIQEVPEDGTQQAFIDVKAI